ncbi:immunoglobulin lambda-1 light chain-like [Protopterus annectens]|uniref:immunoglobulin lambda-1 light chain-like n=1 Tax=Protopterus annectens TaxID=7888 RepID=UPI001CFB1346|nr:immunoglobulin lambda-1 light chain-like [Protopterus annectens]
MFTIIAVRVLKICNMQAAMLLLVIFLPALDTQLIQFPHFLKVRAGEPVSLICTIHNGSASCFEIVWYFQQHMEPPQRVDTVKRFSIGGGTLAKDCQLNISSTRKTDSGMYFCSKCSYSFSVFGKGTKLIVTDRQDEKPFVVILAPPPEDISNRKNVTLVCLVYDPPSDDISISWNVSGNVMKGQMGTGMISQNGDYTISNLLTIATEVWLSEPSIICTAGTEDKKYERHTETEEPNYNAAMYSFLGIMIAVLLIIIMLLFTYYQKEFQTGK